MIRSILILLAGALYLVLGLPVLGAEWLLMKRDRKKSIDRQFRQVQWIFHIFELLAGVDATVLGLENVPKDTGVLYIANHNSFFDVFLTYWRCPSTTGYISKKEFRKIPILPIWMGRTYCLFLDREDPRQGLKTILTAADYIKKDGASIFIFPEGTRSKTGEMADFKLGSFKVATKAGCPIIPVAMSGTADILENHMPRVKKAKVVINYGKPIILDDLTPEDRKHIDAYTQDIIRRMLEENQKYM